MSGNGASIVCVIAESGSLISIVLEFVRSPAAPQRYHAHMRASAQDPISALAQRGFDIEYRSHAKSILIGDFGPQLKELAGVLSDLSLPITEIIGSGGGETRFTQRTRRALTQLGWVKHQFVVTKNIDGMEREATSHEVDHVRRVPAVGTIGCEIEWNNKDPFFDRDLENFKRLHADGAISVGVIVTRGKSLHDNMRKIVRRFLDDRQIQNFENLRQWKYEPTSRQRAAINYRMERAKNPLTFREAFAEGFVADKFGEATTHWRKLEGRVHRGVGADRGRNRRENPVEGQRRFHRVLRVGVIRVRRRAGAGRG